MTININTKLLIAAPMLQDFLIDKTGIPMANGTITLYHDLNRSFLKNWYYQTGTPGAYQWLPLPNPLTLSAAGTITDVNGVDTIPFYYPYLETDQTTPDAYYIVIQNADQTNQITRANFPFISNQSNQPTTVTTFQNLITNNGFWRNYLPNNPRVANQSITFVAPGNAPSSTTLVLASTPVQIGSFTTWYNATVAPSQHDGFYFPDIQFIKDTTTAADVCTFTPFPLSTNQPIKGTNTPEYYISHNSPSGGGETIKCYQFPIALHVNNLTSLPYTVQIQAQSVSGTPTMTLKLLQYAGTGVSSTAPITIDSTTFTLTTGWQTYTLSDVFPSSSGLVLGQGSDDAYYLQVSLPTSSAFVTNFTKPSLYLTTNIAPAFDFQTYDQVNAIISSPRTGDVRVSANSFYPYGWVPLNDTVIGLSNTSGSTAYIRANADTWPLFNVLWNYGKPYESMGNPNPICQMVNIPNSFTINNINYGSTAIGDFTGSTGTNALYLSKAMGRALLGAVPLPVSSRGGNTQGVTFTNQSGFFLANISNGSFFFQGQTIIFTALTESLPTGLLPNTIYYVSVITGNTFLIATTYANAIAGSPIMFAMPPLGATYQVTNNIPGSYLGQYAHLQLEAEMAQHNHPGSTFPGTTFTMGAAGGASTYYTTGGTTALTIANDPPNPTVPFNIVQPGTFYNMYIKL